jgi:hypothetical protein
MGKKTQPGSARLGPSRAEPGYTRHGRHTVWRFRLRRCLVFEHIPRFCLPCSCRFFLVPVVFSYFQARGFILLVPGSIFTRLLTPMLHLIVSPALAPPSSSSPRTTPLARLGILGGRPAEFHCGRPSLGFGAHAVTGSVDPPDCAGLWRGAKVVEVFMSSAEGVINRYCTSLTH